MLLFPPTLPLHEASPKPRLAKREPQSSENGHMYLFPFAGVCVYGHRNHSGFFPENAPTQKFQVDRAKSPSWSKIPHVKIIGFLAVLFLIDLSLCYLMD